MSRIVHGESNEVRAVRMNRPNDSGPRAVTLRSFKGFTVEGTYTQQELHEFVARAKEEGKQEGAAEAEARVSEPLTQALQNLETIMDNISSFRRDLFKESEQDILELVRALAKRVVFKELSLDPKLLAEIVGKGIEFLEREKRISMSINGKDFEIFQVAKADFMQKYKGVEELSFSVDNNVQPGSAIIKTQTVELDVKLDDMVDHLLNQITSSNVQAVEANDEGDKI